MPKMTIAVIGKENCLKACARRMAPMLTVTAQKALGRSADVMVPFVKEAAPIDTGETRASVKILSREGLRVVGGPTTWYKHFVIFGTKRGVEPNPWVARGARRGRPLAKSTFATMYFGDVKK